MAFSTQKNFFKVSHMNEPADEENVCRNVCVTMQPYNAVMDDRSWAMDDVLQSKFFERLLLCDMVEIYDVESSDDDSLQGDNKPRDTKKLKSDRNGELGQNVVRGSYQPTTSSPRRDSKSESKNRKKHKTDKADRERTTNEERYDRKRDKNEYEQRDSQGKMIKPYRQQSDIGSDNEDMDKSPQKYKQNARGDESEFFENDDLSDSSERKSGRESLREKRETSKGKRPRTERNQSDKRNSLNDFEEIDRNKRDSLGKEKSKYDDAYSGKRMKEPQRTQDKKDEGKQRGSKISSGDKSEKEKETDKLETDGYLNKKKDRTIDDKAAAQNRYRGRDTEPEYKKGDRNRKRNTNESQYRENDDLKKTREPRATDARKSEVKNIIDTERRIQRNGEGTQDRSKDYKNEEQRRITKHRDKDTPLKKSTKQDEIKATLVKSGKDEQSRYYGDKKQPRRSDSIGKDKPLDEKEGKVGSNEGKIQDKYAEQRRVSKTRDEKKTVQKERKEDRDSTYEESQYNDYHEEEREPKRSDSKKTEGKNKAKDDTKDYKDKRQRRESMAKNGKESKQDEKKGEQDKIGEKEKSKERDREDQETKREPKTSDAKKKEGKDKKLDDNRSRDEWNEKKDKEHQGISKKNQKNINEEKYRVKDQNEKKSKDHKDERKEPSQAIDEKQIVNKKTKQEDMKETQDQSKTNEKRKYSDDKRRSKQNRDSYYKENEQTREPKAKIKNRTEEKGRGLDNKEDDEDNSVKKNQQGTEDFKDDERNKETYDKKTKLKEMQQKDLQKRDFTEDYYDDEQKKDFKEREDKKIKKRERRPQDSEEDDEHHKEHMKMLVNIVAPNIKDDNQKGSRFESNYQQVENERKKEDANYSRRKEETDENQLPFGENRRQQDNKKMDDKSKYNIERNERGHRTTNNINQDTDDNRDLSDRKNEGVKTLVRSGDRDETYKYRDDRDKDVESSVHKGKVAGKFNENGGKSYEVDHPGTKLQKDMMRRDKSTKDTGDEADRRKHRTDDNIGIKGDVDYERGRRPRKPVDSRSQEIYNDIVGLDTDIKKEHIGVTGGKRVSKEEIDRKKELPHNIKDEPITIRSGGKKETNVLEGDFKTHKTEAELETDETHKCLCSESQKTLPRRSFIAKLFGLDDQKSVHDEIVVRRSLLDQWFGRKKSTSPKSTCECVQQLNRTKDKDIYLPSSSKIENTSADSSILEYEDNIEKFKFDRGGDIFLPDTNDYYNASFIDGNLGKNSIKDFCDRLKYLKNHYILDSDGEIEINELCSMSKDFLQAYQCISAENEELKTLCQKLGNEYSEIDAERLKRVTMERDELRKKCQNYREIEKKYSSLQEKNSYSCQAIKKLSCDLDKQNSFISNLELKCREMQMFYDHKCDSVCNEKEMLESEVNSLKEELFSIQCTLNNVNSVQRENAFLTNEVQKLEAALNDYDCQYKCLMRVVEEELADKCKFSKQSKQFDHNSSNGSDSIEDVAYFTKAVLLAIKNRIEDGGDFDTNAKNIENIEKDYKKSLEDVQEDCEKVCCEAMVKVRTLMEENAILRRAHCQMLNENDCLMAKLKSNDCRIKVICDKLCRLDRELCANAKHTAELNASLTESATLIKEIGDYQYKNQILEEATKEEQCKMLKELQEKLEYKTKLLQECQCKNEEYIKITDEAGLKLDHSKIGKENESSPYGVSGFIGVEISKRERQTPEGYQMDVSGVIEMEIVKRERNIEKGYTYIDDTPAHKADLDENEPTISSKYVGKPESHVIDLPPDSVVQQSKIKSDDETVPLNLDQHQATTDILVENIIPHELSMIRPSESASKKRKSRRKSTRGLESTRKLSIKDDLITTGDEQDQNEGTTARSRKSVVRPRRSDQLVKSENPTEGTRRGSVRRSDSEKVSPKRKSKENDVNEIGKPKRSSRRVIEDKNVKDSARDQLELTDTENKKVTDGKNVKRLSKVRPSKNKDEVPDVKNGKASSRVRGDVNDNKTPKSSSRLKDNITDGENEKDSPRGKPKPKREKSTGGDTTQPQSEKSVKKSVEELEKRSRKKGRKSKSSARDSAMTDIRMQSSPERAQTSIDRKKKCIIVEQKCICKDCPYRTNKRLHICDLGYDKLLQPMPVCFGYGLIKDNVYCPAKIPSGILQNIACSSETTDINEKPKKLGKPKERKKGGQEDIDENENNAYRNFVQAYSLFLTEQMKNGENVQEVLRVILDALLEECGFCFCKNRIPKGKFYIICHKILHRGIQCINFNELLYLHGKIVKTAESLQPGELMSYIQHNFFVQNNSIVEDVLAKTQSMHDRSICALSEDVSLKSTKRDHTIQELSEAQYTNDPICLYDKKDIQMLKKSLQNFNELMMDL